MSRRFQFAIAALVPALAVFVWSGDSGSVAAPTAVHGSAELIECSRGKRATDRRAVFRGEMTQLESGLRMQMRFHLAEKVGSSPWVATRAPGLNVPREARPGITRFAYRQRVVALEKGTSYRVDIMFRWLTADGVEVRREVERSPVCRQPGKLANLKIRDAVHVSPGPTSDTRRYLVRVGNMGNRTAKRVALSLFVDGAEIDTRRIGRLDPADRRAVRFVGPVCVAEVVARIDPADLIPEITERDNSITSPCDTS